MKNCIIVVFFIVLIFVNCENPFVPEKTRVKYIYNENTYVSDDNPGTPRGCPAFSWYECDPGTYNITYKKYGTYGTISGGFSYTVKKGQSKEVKIGR